MASDKRASPCQNSNVYCCRFPSTQKELKFFGVATMSFDDELAARASRMKLAQQSPKFLRTQSSGGLFASPRKSRSATRFIGGLISNMSNSTASDTYGSNGSIPDKNYNYSSLNNLSRPQNLSQSSHSMNYASKLALMHSTENTIDEDCEFQHAKYEPPEIASENTSNQRTLNPMTLLRAHRFRSRSISVDSWEQNDKTDKR